MTNESRANYDATTTLAGNYTAGSGTLNVTTTGAPMPTAARFTVAVSDPSTKANKVLLRVTGITDGTHYAVTAIGTDANASTGDIVNVVDDVVSEANWHANRHQIGTFANIPTSGMQEGDTYQCTDSGYRAVYDGSDWKYFYPGVSFQVTPPPDIGSLTQINMSAFTASTVGGVLRMVCPRSGSGEYRGLVCENMPSRPFTFTVGFRVLNCQFLYNYTGVCCALLEASPSDKFNEELIFFGSGGAQLATQRMTSPTASSGAGDGNPSPTVNCNWGKMFFARWVVEGGSGNRYPYFSDSGEVFQLVHSNSVAWNSVQTPARVGIGGLNYNGSTVPDFAFEVFHWELS